MLKITLRCVALFLVWMTCMVVVSVTLMPDFVIYQKVLIQSGETAFLEDQSLTILNNTDSMLTVYPEFIDASKRFYTLCPSEIIVSNDDRDGLVYPQQGRIYTLDGIDGDEINVKWFASCGIMQQMRDSYYGYQLISGGSSYHFEVESMWSESENYAANTFAIIQGMDYQEYVLLVGELRVRRAVSETFYYRPMLIPRLFRAGLINPPFVCE